MQLTKNIFLHELVKSPAALRLGIDNSPNEEIIRSLKLVAENILQLVRDHYNSPLIPSSGYRCPALNKLVGGDVNSQHLKGEAADFEVLGIPNLSVAKWIRDNLNFDQLILEYYTSGDPYSGWVHCSYRSDSTNRKQVLTICNDGKFTGLRG